MQTEMGESNSAPKSNTTSVWSVFGYMRVNTISFGTCQNCVGLLVKCASIVVSLSSLLPKLTESNSYVLALSKQVAGVYDYLQALNCMAHKTLVLFSTTLCRSVGVLSTHLRCYMEVHLKHWLAHLRV